MSTMLIAITAAVVLLGIGRETLDDDYDAIFLAFAQVPHPDTIPFPVAVSAIFDNSTLALGGAISVDTIEIGGNTYAVVAGQTDNGIQIINITDPVRPVPVSSFVNGTTGSSYLTGAWSVTTTIINDTPYAIVAASGDTGGFVIINLENPANPRLASERTDGQGEFTGLAGARAISTTYIHDRPYALVGSNTENSIHVVDISEPTEPNVVSTITHGVDNFLLEGPRAISHVTINDIPYAIVASFAGNQTQIINLGNPFEPQAGLGFVDGVIGGLITLSGPRSVDTTIIGEGTYAVVTSQHENSIQIINITTPAAPIPLSSVTGTADTNGRALGGARSVDITSIDGRTYAVVAGRTDNGTQIIDISDPANPVPIHAILDDMNGFTALAGASSVDITVIDDTTYAVVASNEDNAIQIIEMVDVPAVAPTAALFTDVSSTTNLGTIPFTVSFSQPVTEFDRSDIDISPSGIAENLESATALQRIIRFANFDEPTNVAINSTGHIFVVDFGNHHVQIFNDSGNRVGQLGTGDDFGNGDGAGNNQFDFPSGIAINSTGHIFVADSGNNRVQVYDSSNAYQGTIGTGSQGSDPGEFNSPSDIAINSTGYIFVADTNNNRVQIFDSAGTPISNQLGNGTFGSTNEQLARPSDIAINSTGYIFVTDTLNHRIQIYDSSNAYLGTIGTTGGDGNADGDRSDVGEFDSPSGIAINSMNHIFVADSGNNRVQIFDDINTPITTPHVAQLTGTVFAQPIDVDINPTNDLVYVADTDNDQILIFNPHSYTFDVTDIPASDLTIQVQVPAGVARGMDNLYNTESNVVSVAIARMMPTVLSASANETAIQLVMSEPVTDNNAAPADFVVTGTNFALTVDSIAVSGDIVTLTLSDGEIVYADEPVLTYANSGDDSNNNILNANNNQLGYFEISVVNTVDVLGPMITIISDVPGPATNLDIIPFTVSFDRYVFGFASSSIATSSGIAQEPSPLTVLQRILAGDDNFEEANDVAVNSTGHIFVADTLNHRIQIFDGEGVPQGQIGEGNAGSTREQLRSPFGIAINSMNHIYIADTGNHRIQIFDASNVYQGTIGTGIEGKELGEFNSPTDIAINSAGYIYIADTGNHRIQIFDDLGVPQDQLGDGKEGAGINSFRFPSNVAINSMNHIYVADTFNHRIQIFDSSNVYQGTIGTGSRGSDPGEFEFPSGIAINSMNHIYVADTDNDRIQIFDDANEPILTSSVEAITQIKFNRPNDVAVDPITDLIYVADTGNHSIQIFNPNVFTFGVAGATDQKMLNVSIQASTVQDRNGRYNIASNVASIDIDRMNPTVLSASANSTAVRLLISESITGSNIMPTEFILGGIASNPAVDSLIISDNIITLIIDQTSRITNFDSEITVSYIRGSSILDRAQNPLESFEDQPVRHADDLDLPGIMLSLGPGVVSPTSLPIIPFVVSFSEPVAGFTAGDIEHSPGQIINFVEPVAILPLLDSFGMFGTGETQFDHPFGVAVNSSGHIFVADAINHRIQIFDKDFNHQGRIGGLGDNMRTSATNNLGFLFPIDVFVDGSDQVYVADLSNHRVQIFNSSNDYQGTIGTTGMNGRGNEQLDLPRIVVTNSSGHIFVADSKNHRVQIYDSSGTWQQTLGRTDGKPGAGINEFDIPHGIAFNSTGYIYIADLENNRIAVYDRSGVLVTYFGNNTDEFKGPTDLVFDSEDNLYVSSSINNCIVVYNSTHAVQNITHTIQNRIGGNDCADTFDDRGLGIITGFTTRNYIALDSENNHLYVTNTQGPRVQVLGLRATSTNATFDVVNAPNGILTVSIPADAAQDNRMNNSTASNIVSILIDRPNAVWFAFTTPTITDDATAVASFARSVSTTPTISDDAMTTGMFRLYASSTPAITHGAVVIKPTLDPIEPRTIPRPVLAASSTPAISDKSTAVNMFAVSVSTTPTITDDAAVVASFARSAITTPAISDSAMTAGMFSLSASSEPMISDGTMTAGMFRLSASSEPVISDGSSTEGMFRLSASSVPTISDSAMTTGMFSLSASSEPMISDGTMTAGMFRLSASSEPVISDGSSTEGMFRLSASSVPTISDSAMTTGMFRLFPSSTPVITDDTTAVASFARSALTSPAISDMATVTGMFRLHTSSTPVITDDAAIAGMFSLSASSEPVISDSSSTEGMFRLSAFSEPTISDDAMTAGMFRLTASSVPMIVDSSSTEGMFRLSAFSVPTISDSAMTTGMFRLTASSEPTISDDAMTTGMFSLSASSEPTISDDAMTTGMFRLTASSEPIISDDVTATGMFELVASSVPTISDDAMTTGMFRLFPSSTPAITDDATAVASFARSAITTPTISDTVRVCGLDGCTVTTSTSSTPAISDDTIISQVTMTPQPIPPPIEPSVPRDTPNTNPPNRGGGGGSTNRGSQDDGDPANNPVIYEVRYDVCDGSDDLYVIVGPDTVAMIVTITQAKTGLTTAYLTGDTSLPGRHVYHTTIQDIDSNVYISAYSIAGRNGFVASATLVPDQDSCQDNFVFEDYEEMVPTTDVMPIEPELEDIAEPESIAEPTPIAEPAPLPDTTPRGPGSNAGSAPLPDTTPRGSEPIAEPAPIAEPPPLPDTVIDETVPRMSIIDSIFAISSSTVDEMQIGIVIPILIIIILLILIIIYHRKARNL